MKTCFLVTTYCDTDEKLNSLKNTINRIKDYGYDIILYNHFPISDSILSKVKFSIYDKSNPVIWDMKHRSMVIWTRVFDTPYKISRCIPDYGYAVAQQWKRGIEFIYKSGYEKVYIINYDTKFSDNFFERVNVHLENNVNFAIEYGKGSLYLAFFGAKLTNEFVKLFDTISLSHYMNNIGEGIAEQYIYSILSNTISKLHTFDEFDVNDITSAITIATVDRVHSTSEYTVTAGVEKFVFGDETPTYGRLAVLFYNIKTDINFLVDYDSIEVMKVKIPNYMKHIYIQLPFEDYNLDYDKVRFLINDVDTPELLNYMKTVTIETLYQTF